MGSEAGFACRRACWLATDHVAWVRQGLPQGECGQHRAAAGGKGLMMASGERARGDRRPVLAGRRIRIRPGRRGDGARLDAILAEPSVRRWWPEPASAGELEQDLRSDGSSVLLVVEIDGQVAGGIQYHEEDDPMYRHAGIDIYLATRFQGQGAGAEAITLLARFLFGERGHHRITIDPAAANEHAIRCYAKAGFRPVGIMRQYERGHDGRFHDGLLMDLLRDELTGT